MISLAATANGANIVVECVRETGVTQIDDVPGRLSSYAQEDPLFIRLWLVQPPTTMMHEIRSDFRNFATNVEDDPNLLSLPVYGGMLEIATHISNQLGCELSSEEALALWQGVSVGRCALWLIKSSFDPGFGYFSLFFDDELLKSELVASIGSLTDGYYRVPRGDGRHRLARNAACILHQVLKYSRLQQLRRRSIQDFLGLNNSGSISWLF